MATLLQFDARLLPNFFCTPQRIRCGSMTTISPAHKFKQHADHWPCSAPTSTMFVVCRHGPAQKSERHFDRHRSAIRSLLNSLGRRKVGGDVAQLPPDSSPDRQWRTGKMNLSSASNRFGAKRRLRGAVLESAQDEAAAAVCNALATTTVRVFANCARA